MANNIFSITCPDNCSTATISVLPADVSCQLGTSQSEVDMVIFQEDTVTGPTDMSAAADWATLINNTDATGTKMKYLIGSGSVAEPEDTVVTVARGQEILTSRTYTMTFTVFDISTQQVYDFCRKIQCGGVKPKIFFTDLDNLLYGKVVSTGPDSGIELSSIKVSMPKDAGKEGLNKAVFVFKWLAKTDPDRVANPLTL
jgi:hypothetical protein